MPEKSRMTEPQLIAALRERYPTGAYAFLEQLRNGTGYQRETRTADAVVMSLWPSRGLELHGFELKVSRTDWKRELENPAKAEEIGRFCHRWWLVVGSEEIVQPGELPPTWGLLVPRKDKLFAKVDAPVREAQSPTWLFVAAILRNATAADDAAITKLVNQRIFEEHERNRKREQERKKTEESVLQQRMAKLEANVKAFEDASGIQINEWSHDGGRIGELVNLLLRGQYDAQAVERAARQLEDAAKETRAAADALKAIATKGRAA